MSVSIRPSRDWSQGIEEGTIGVVVVGDGPTSRVSLSPHAVTNDMIIVDMTTAAVNDPVTSAGRVLGDLDRRVGRVS